MKALLVVDMVNDIVNLNFFRRTVCMDPEEMRFSRKWPPNPAKE
ncbi:MAG: hypothetical protein R6U91_08505 [Bacillota bacterium]